MSKSPPRPSNAPDESAKHLQRITHQHFFRSFEDWLALTINAFLRDDPSCLNIMARYGRRAAPMGDKDHPADHFARALGTWMSAMQVEPADYFGRVSEEQALTNNHAGQFFTPEPLVELMAAMTMPDDLSDTALVHDPACGSGRMLIAGIKRNRSATFLGTDTDLTCVHTTTLNYLTRNVNSYVIHGNSLSLETWGGYHVRRTPVGGDLFRLTREQTNKLIEAPLISSTAAGTALTSPSQAQLVQEPAQEAKAAQDTVARSFKVDKQGQGEFEF